MKCLPVTKEFGGYARECVLRKTGKDNPSINSSSVTTWYLPGAIGGVTPLFRLVGPSFASHACWLISPFFATGVGWWGARKRGVPLPCVTSVYTTSSHAPQRSVTSLRPATSTPVHVGLPHLRIPQRRSAFFPERSSPFPPR